MKSDARLALYNAALVAFAPLLLAKKAIKFGRRGHRHEWDRGRWQTSKLPPKSARRVVLVALSWGEVGILNALSHRLETQKPDWEIVWSIRDRAAQELAARHFSGRRIVSMPFDFALPTAAWLESVRPDIVVIIEKFWWPNLVWGAKNRGVRVVLVNGRSRGREKLRYRLMSGFQSWVLSGFDRLLFESESQVERVRAVLPPDVRVEATGNLKFAFEGPAPPNARTLESWLAARARDENGVLPLLIAGSTAPVDEKWALEAWQRARQTAPCALLIAPRRVERAGEVARFFEAAGHPVSRRAAPVSGAEVLLLDTLGELFFVFGFGLAAYIGGSVEGRGHNIIEPLAQGLGVAYGPLRGDFEAAQRAAEDSEVGFRCHSSAELARFWEKILTDAGFRAELSARARELLERQKGALDQVVDALLEELG